MGTLIGKLLHVLDARDSARLVLLVLLVVVGALVETIGVALVPAFVVLLSSPEEVSSFLRAHGLEWFVAGRSTLNLVLWAGLGIAGFFLLKNSLLVLTLFVQTKFVATQQTRLASRLLSAYVHGPYTFHLHRNTAELLRNISLEVHRVFMGVLNPLLILAGDVVVITFIGILLVLVEPVASGIAVITLGGSALLYYHLLRGRFGSWGQLQQHHSGEMMKWVNQSLGGVKETKVLGREEFFLNAYRRHVVPFVKAVRMEQTMNQVPRFLIETMAVVGMVAVISAMIATGREVEAILPGLALFAAAALRIMPLINRMVSAATMIRAYRYAVDVIHTDIVALTEQRTLASPGVEASGEEIPFSREIELRNVSYRYHGAVRDAVCNVSLTIPRGRSVAFVGPSGSGKTTLVDIILGLLPPTHGEVLMDGRNILDILPIWRRKVGYIPQSVYLSDDSIRRNVAFGIPDDLIVDEVVWTALEAAQLAELVRSLPEQLDTFVGERGVRLSGGQRQRIGIARALYHDPEILVMDEATSALDHHTEREITEVLDNYHMEKTMIVIAHRLSTVRHCDILFFMSDGRPVQSGSYDELLADCREFQMMVG